MGENGGEYLPEIGIGIKHGKDRQRGDGEESERIAGAGGHNDLFQTRSIGLALS
jgi:hypothetical protein